MVVHFCGSCYELVTSAVGPPGRGRNPRPDHSRYSLGTMERYLHDLAFSLTARRPLHTNSFCKKGDCSGWGKYHFLI